MTSRSFEERSSRSPSFSTLLKVVTSGYVWSGLLLYGAAFVLYLYILSKYEVSYIAPITMSLIFVLLLLFSTWFLHESFTAKKAIGIVVVAAGIWLMA